MRNFIKRSLLFLLTLCIAVCSVSILITNNVEAASKVGKTKTYTRTIKYHKNKLSANPVYLKYTIKQNTKTHVITSKSVKCINADNISQSLKIKVYSTGGFTITGNVKIPGKGYEFGAGNCHEGISCVSVKVKGNFKTGDWQYYQ